MSQETETYNSMLHQLDKVIHEVNDSEKQDLDKLVSKVEFGYELIHKLKDRLENVKMKVEELSKAEESKV